MGIIERNINRIWIILRLVKRCIMYVLPDKIYLQIQYKDILGKKLNINNPQSFNEKLQWLKLYDRNPIYTRFADKYEVKKVVSERIGEQYIVPTLGIWKEFETIDFEQLPNQFVLKCTHDSGSAIVVRDKQQFDRENAKKKINHSLRQNYYKLGREWVYKDIEPRIIAEEYIGEIDDTESIIDYKFLCFGGKVKCSFTCTNRGRKGGLRVTFYDREWNKMPFERHYPSEAIPMPRPGKYEEMVAMAERLSEGICFVRVDFYQVDNKVLFGEMTFYPGDGYEEFTPEEWDYRLGEWIDLELCRNDK